MSERPDTPLLDQVNLPADLRKLEREKLRQLADELRAEMIDAVGTTGGHLGSGLGVVELTVAIHYIFNTPEDRLIWDVGHQCYPHKIITGRRDRIRTLRQGGGLSGFTKRSESEYDPFGAAHSSTSISAGLGFAIANKLNDQPGKAIAVIGDGAMSAGMAFEAMNNAGAVNTRMIVILNDNDMSIAPPVGALSAYLLRLISSKPFRSARDLAKELAKKFPRPIGEAAAKGRDISLKDNAVRVRDGHTGPREAGTIGFATLRGGNVIGDHMVILAGQSERIELTHRAQDRTIYANGAVKAALWAATQQPGLYSMADVLGLND